jgi:hypothetical protein
VRFYPMDVTQVMQYVTLYQVRLQQRADVFDILMRAHALIFYGLSLSAHNDVFPGLFPHVSAFSLPSSR